jgi:hypothetical protein
MMLLPDLRGKTGGSRTIYRSDSERSEGAAPSRGVGACASRMAREKLGGRILGRCVRYTSAICTSCFPRFFPCSMPMNASGAFSMPRAMSSR